LRIPVTNASWEPILPSADAPDAVDASVDDGESGVGEAAVAEAPMGPSAPALYVWDGAVETTATPARDAYALRLVAGHLLYDAGSTVTESPSLSPLAPGSVLLLHRSDRERIGVDDGGDVRVTTMRGSLTLTVRADDATPPGVAFLAFNQPGAGAGDLIDATEPVTDLRVESLR
ncbi:MAG: molybdopterin dinucleotide binding domain-containing protein, partial [Acidimicrobiia bacterium]